MGVHVGRLLGAHAWEPADGALRARRIYVSEDDATVYQAVVDRAVELVIGCDHACIMLVARPSSEAR